MDKTIYGQKIFNIVVPQVGKRVGVFSIQTQPEIARTATIDTVLESIFVNCYSLTATPRLKPD